MVVGEKKHAPYGPDGRIKRTDKPPRPRPPPRRVRGTYDERDEWETQSSRRSRACPSLRTAGLQLAWDLSTKAEQAIVTALSTFRKLIDDISLEVITHDAYGKVCAPVD